MKYGKGEARRGKGKEGMIHCCKKGKGMPEDREGNGGHGSMLGKRERDAREEGRERWACYNVVKKEKGCQRRGKGKVGM